DDSRRAKYLTCIRIRRLFVTSNKTTMARTTASITATMRTLVPLGVLEPGPATCQVRRSSQVSHPHHCVPRKHLTFPILASHFQCPSQIYISRRLHPHTSTAPAHRST